MPVHNRKYEGNKKNGNRSSSRKQKVPHITEKKCFVLQHSHFTHKSSYTMLYKKKNMKSAVKDSFLTYIHLLLMPFRLFFFTKYTHKIFILFYFMYNFQYLE